MIDIQYKIQLHTYWHCGSGLAAGADVDALVIKDKEGCPYIPGKTIKGLIREAVDEIEALKYEQVSFTPSQDYLDTFGYFKDDKDDKATSISFFTNAKLDDNEHKAITDGGLARFMYDSVSQTAIDNEGIAVSHSLRKTEVVVPCTLYGKILNLPDGMYEHIENGMKFIKNLGLDRNRGLGRCTFSIEGKEERK